MVLRKIPVDNSVRHVAKNEQTKEKEIKPKSIKAGSLPREQSKKFSQIKKSLKL